MKPNCFECPVQGTTTCENCPFPVTALTFDDTVADYKAAGKFRQRERKAATLLGKSLNMDEILAGSAIPV